MYWCCNQRNVLNGKQHAKFADRQRSKAWTYKGVTHVVHSHTNCMRASTIDNRDLTSSSIYLHLILVAVDVGFCNCYCTQDGRKGGGEKPKVLIVYQ